MAGDFQWFEGFRVSLSGTASVVLPLAKWLDVSAVREAHVAVIATEVNTGAAVTVALVTCPIISSEATGYVDCDTATIATSTTTDQALNLQASVAESRLPPQGYLGIQVSQTSGTSTLTLQAFALLKQ